MFLLLQGLSELQSARRHCVHLSSKKQETHLNPQQAFSGLVLGNPHQGRAAWGENMFARAANREQKAPSRKTEACTGYRCTSHRRGAGQTLLPLRMIPGKQINFDVSWCNLGEANQFDDISKEWTVSAMAARAMERCSPSSCSLHQHWNLIITVPEVTLQMEYTAGHMRGEGEGHIHFLSGKGPHFTPSQARRIHKWSL